MSSVSELRTRLASVRTAIDTVLAGGVSEFTHEGGDGAKLLSLKDLQAMENNLLAQLSAINRRANRFSKGRRY